jgi:hypothetical protein
MSTARLMASALLCPILALLCFVAVTASYVRHRSKASSNRCRGSRLNRPSASEAPTRSRTEPRHAGKRCRVLRRALFQRVVG